MENGASVHRKLTLAQQLSVIERSNLRNLLRIRDEDDQQEESDTIPVNRTLAGASLNNKNRRKSLKDHLCNHRAPVSGDISGEDYKFGISQPSPFPATQFTGDSISAISETITTFTGNSITGDSISTPVPPENSIKREEASTMASLVLEESAIPAVNETGAPARNRVSLMMLLEETDVNGEVLMAVNEEEKETEEEEEDVKYVCCVCMVRHKGAAFIPCGHTFCRICSRELWVSRGNCPLCNVSIVEILDIF